MTSDIASVDNPVRERGDGREEKRMAREATLPLSSLSLIIMSSMGARPRRSQGSLGIINQFSFPLLHIRSDGTV